jgi:hypothetical protein
MTPFKQRGDTEGNDDFLLLPAGTGGLAAGRPGMKPAFRPGLRFVESGPCRPSVPGRSNEIRIERLGLGKF